MAMFQHERAAAGVSTKRPINEFFGWTLKIPVAFASVSRRTTRSVRQTNSDAMGSSKIWNCPVPVTIASAKFRSNAVWRR